uniref:Uncharacterized protein n=1 Tax=Solanum lycopersicum TaxID=4081 RepID=A0A3Q7FK78_SOLLC
MLTKIPNNHLISLKKEDFTLVTSPAFGIPLLAVKVTTLAMKNSHSVTGDSFTNNSSLSNGSFYSNTLSESYQHLYNLFLANRTLLD